MTRHSIPGHSIACGSRQDRTDIRGSPAARPLPDGGTDHPVAVGVKLGSTRTVLVFPSQDGGLQVVRTLTCLASYENPITGDRSYAFGDEAAAEYPGTVEFPLRSGLPSDGEQTEQAYRFFQAVVDSHDVPQHSVVVYATPTTEDSHGMENLGGVIAASGIGTAGIDRYPEALCGAIPALGDGLEAVDEVFLALNLGSTKLELAAYRRGEQIGAYQTGAVSGNEIDREIINNVENETGGRVHLDINTAREYKEAHADFEQFEPVTDVIQGPDGRHEFTVDWSIMEAVEGYLDRVVEVFTEEFLPQLANTNRQVYRLAADQPVVLTGGMACLPGIVEAFEHRVGELLNEKVDAIAPKRADISASIGAYRIAKQLTG